MRALTDTPVGPVIRALLSQIAVNTELGDPLRASVVQGRAIKCAMSFARGVARGDLQPDVNAVRLSVALNVHSRYHDASTADYSDTGAGSRHTQGREWLDDLRFATRAGRALGAP